MDQLHLSRSPDLLAAERVDMTVDFVLSLIAADETIPLKKRHDICSGVRSLCRAIGLPPDSTAASPRVIAERLADLTPAAARMSKGRLQNCRSHMETALAYADVEFQRRRKNKAMGPAFQLLLDQMTDKWAARRLRPLFHFATEHEVGPSGINDDLCARFLAAQERSTHPKVRARDREIRKTWNTLVASLDDPSLARVSVPSYVDHYVLPADAFPALLWNDLDAYLIHRQKHVDANLDDLLSDDELFGDGASSGPVGKPIRPSTANLIRYRVRQFASILVHEGVIPATEITGLAALVPPVIVNAGMKFFLRRVPDRRNSQMRGIASDLLMIATLWVRSPDVDLKKLRMIVEKVRPQHEGLPESAKRSLAPVRDIENARAFLRISDQIVRDAEKSKTLDEVTANRVATALWIKIAQRAPLRISQLLGTDIVRNVVRSHAGKNAAVALCYTAEEGKNGKPLEIPLPRATVALLDLYLKKYRPALVDGPTTALFPALNCEPKLSSVMSSDVQRLMREYVGFAINPHSFRHVAAKLYLLVHPGQHAKVQTILGHKKLETTMRYYCELDAEETFKHFDAVLLGLESDERGGGRK